MMNVYDVRILLDHLSNARIYAGAEFERLCNNSQYVDACVFQSIRDSIALNIQLLESYIKNKSESDEQTTENKCDTMVKEIREYCGKNHCASCEAFTRFGCIFKSGYHPDQWITTKEAEGDIFLNRRIK